MDEFALTSQYFAQDPTEEYVPTPVWATAALLRVHPELLLIQQPVLEPAAGTGSIMRVLMACTPMQVWGCELNEERVRLVETEFGWSGETRDSRMFCGDFLSPVAQSTLRGIAWRAMVTNPPFSLWVPFVRVALAMMKPDGLIRPGGIVAMLGPLEYYGGLERSALYLPGTGFKAKHTFARRLWPKVKAATWYVWEEGFTGAPTTTILLDGP